MCADLRRELRKERKRWAAFEGLYNSVKRVNDRLRGKLGQQGRRQRTDRARPPRLTDFNDNHEALHDQRMIIFKAALVPLHGTPAKVLQEMAFRDANCLQVRGPP